MNPQYSYYGPNYNPDSNYPYVQYSGGQQVTFNYTQGQQVYPPQFEYEYETPQYPSTSYVGFEPEYYPPGYNGMQTNFRQYADAQTAVYQEQYDGTQHNLEQPDEHKNGYNNTQRNSEQSQENQGRYNGQDQRGSAPHYMASRHYRNKARQPGSHGNSKVATGSVAKSATVRSAEVHVDRSVPPQPVEVSVKLGQDDDVDEDETTVQSHADKSKQPGRYTGNEFTTRRKNNNFGRSNENVGSGRFNRYRYKSDYEDASAPRGGYRGDYRSDYYNERGYSGRGGRDRDYRTRQFRSAETYGNSTTFEGQSQKIANTGNKPEGQSDLSSAVDNYLGRQDRHVDNSNSTRGNTRSFRDEIQVSFSNQRASNDRITNQRASSDRMTNQRASSDRMNRSNNDTRAKYRNSTQSKLSENGMNIVQGKDREQNSIEESDSVERMHSKTDSYRDKSSRATQMRKQPRQQSRAFARTMSGNLDESQRGE